MKRLQFELLCQDMRLDRKEENNAIYGREQSLNAKAFKSFDGQLLHMISRYLDSRICSSPTYLLEKLNNCHFTDAIHILKSIPIGRN